MFVRPALEFQLAHGLTDIGTDYVLPVRWPSAEAIETHLEKWGDLAKEFLHPLEILLPSKWRNKSAEKEVLTDLNTILDELIQLNPELKSVDYDRTKFAEVWPVLQGVASGFNTDDINYFLEIRIRNKTSEGHEIERSSAKNKIYAKILLVYPAEHHQHLQDHFIDHMNWIASPQTVQNVQTQLDEKIRALEDAAQTSAVDYVTARREGASRNRTL